MRIVEGFEAEWLVCLSMDLRRGGLYARMTEADLLGEMYPPGTCFGRCVSQIEASRQASQEPRCDI